MEDPFKVKTSLGERTVGLKLMVTTLKLDVRVNFLYLSSLRYQKNLLTRKRRAKQIMRCWLSS